jgi:hypothetical protein
MAGQAVQLEELLQNLGIACCQVSDWLPDPEMSGSGSQNGSMSKYPV